MRTLASGQIVRILWGQLLLTAILVIVSVYFLPAAMLSVLVGGLTSAIPGLFFTRKVFARYDAQYPRE
jgi:F0F1-type ATP synthase assembly protein I